MGLPIVSEKTITYGQNQYKVTSSGEWSVLMWGWFGLGQDRPIYRFEPVATERVPWEVRKLAW
jgi:hypothetical protein